ncbi:MAG TPA: hypothetical protein DD640_04560 [Clostridiales bacterium]|nr:hypothetical protein [Clostridiales bacterium]
MSQEDSYQSILQTFDRCAQEFTRSSGGLFCEILTEYKGGASEAHIKVRTAKIYYNNYILLCQYTAHGLLSTVNSIVACYVMLSKEADALRYPVTAGVDFLDIDTLDCFVIPNISNPAMMAESLNLLYRNLARIQMPIAAQAADEARKETFRSFYIREVERVLQVAITPQNQAGILNIYDKYYLGRMTSGPYLLYLAGNYKKAAGKLARFKGLSSYEQRLLRLLNQAGESAGQAPGSVVENIKLYNALGVPKTDKREMIAVFASAFLWMILWAAVFTPIYFLVYFFLNRGAIYVAGAYGQAPGLFLPSFLMGICTSYFTRRKAYQVLFKKHYLKYQEMDTITNSPGSDKFMKYFSRIVLVGAVLFTLLSARWGIKFTDSGFIDNTRWFSLQGVYHEYADIKQVYYLESRINGFGDILDFPSYVMVYQDGTEQDLYDVENVERTEEELIPILVSRGIPVQR